MSFSIIIANELQKIQRPERRTFPLHFVSLTCDGRSIRVCFDYFSSFVYKQKHLQGRPWTSEATHRLQTIATCHLKNSKAAKRSAPSLAEASQGKPNPTSENTKTRMLASPVKYHRRIDIDHRSADEECGCEKKERAASSVINRKEKNKNKSYSHWLPD